MDKKIRIEDILDDCLERMLNGESIEDCLQYYPWQATKLEPLLRTSSELIQKSAAIQPDPDFKARVHSQLQGKLYAKRVKAEKKASVPVWRGRWAMAMTSVFVVLLAGVATVAASANALPDESLYGMKLATENAMVTLASSGENEAELHIQFAERRTVEIAEMARQGKSDRIPELTEQFTTHLNEVNQVEPRPGSGAKMPQLLAPDVALNRDGAVDDSTSKGGEQEEKLKIMLDNSRARSLSTLSVVLAEAPSEAKASLKQAISDVTQDYDETLADMENAAISATRKKPELSVEQSSKDVKRELRKKAYNLESASTLEVQNKAETSLK